MNSIRQVRKPQLQIDWIRTKLEKAENNGFTNDDIDRILTQSKSLLNGYIPFRYKSKKRFNSCSSFWSGKIWLNHLGIIVDYISAREITVINPIVTARDL